MSLIFGAGDESENSLFALKTCFACGDALLRQN